MTWRDEARPLIAAALDEVPDLPVKERAKHARAAFPWGPRQYHPYRIWCDEVKAQLGTKRPKASRAGGAVAERDDRLPDPRQAALFGGDR
jgi:hypothetical protein